LFSVVPPPIQQFPSVDLAILCDPFLFPQGFFLLPVLEELCRTLAPQKSSLSPFLQVAITALAKEMISPS
jgi:hypothetical protein